MSSDPTTAADVIAEILRQHGYDEKPYEPDIIAPRIIERLKDSGYFVVRREETNNA